MEKKITGAKIIASFCRTQFYTPNKLPLTKNEIELLTAIAYADIRPIPHLLAKELNVSKAMITKTMTSLLERGYIRKIYNQEDKRSYEVWISEEGDEVLGRCYHDYLENVRKLQQHLGEQKYNQLVSLLEEATLILKKNK